MRAVDITITTDRVELLDEMRVVRRSQVMRRNLSVPFTSSKWTELNWTSTGTTNRLYGQSAVLRQFSGGDAKDISACYRRRARPTTYNSVTMTAWWKVVKRWRTVVAAAAEALRVDVTRSTARWYE